jgi:hypothetical protein
MHPYVMPIDALVRSVGVSSDSPHAFFLGAGASVTLGVPHAGQCIWEWKRHIFLTKNPGLEEQFSELSLPSTQERIQRWLEEHGYPRSGDPSEYGLYIEECYPVAEHRRRFFQRLTREARPHVGYRVLCQLAVAGICGSVWTTNFDGLVAKAAAGTSLVPIEVGIDCACRAVRLPTRGELLCVSLHGDYRYDRLKNTAEELRSQDAALRNALIAKIQTTNLIVIGYSGRDESVMEALRAAYNRPGSGELYWCGRGDPEPPPVVQSLLEAARSHGRTAYYVPTEGFDDLLVRLAFHCLKGEQLQAARGVVMEAQQAMGNLRVPFAVERLPARGVIKSNAFRVECPSDVLAFTAALPEHHVWRWVRERTRGRPVLAAPFRGKVIALGTWDAVKDAFGASIQSSIDRSPVDQRELSMEDGVVLSLFRSGLLHAIAGRCGLETDGGRTLWEAEPYDRYRHANVEYRLHHAALLSLRRIGQAQYLVVKPSLRATDSRGAEATRDVTLAIKQAVLGYQHNHKFNAVMQRWQQRLFSKQQAVTLEYPENCGSTFRFRLSHIPAFARVGDLQRGAGIRISPTFEKSLTHAGFELPEPRLLFASAIPGGKPVRDEHPMRGIVQNRPYDFALTSLALADRVSVGVVCPRAEGKRLHEFLAGIVRPRPEPKGGQEYLLDFPGFQAAFRVPLHLPAQPGASGWAVCPEPPEGVVDHVRAVELARQITTSIDTLQSAAAPNVVVIFVPRRWASLREVRTTDTAFDLHDYLKAQCVRRGIATQLIEEDTLADPQQCRVYWWLSLALYGKSKRTPWVIDCLEEGTAYAGLGLSIDTDATTGRHVVLGCSHIYSPRGEGLRYRLSKVENPIIRRGNPYLSEDDARRLGEGIRQLYFDAALRLPDRVVIHKRTPFWREEREGLRQGLAGVRRIDMVEITIEPYLRYIASVVDGRGKFRQDTFPVRRGTVIRLDDFTALLWNHGVTNALQPGKRYYQGKRRIPAPLVLRRHAGEAPLETLAREILGLSKMNWNTFDLYTKFPATITSSNEIARIGTLLDRFSDASYDYRLFM